MQMDDRINDAIYRQFFYGREALQGEERKWFKTKWMEAVDKLLASGYDLDKIVIVPRAK